MNTSKCSYCEFLCFTCKDGQVFFKCLNPKGNCKTNSVEKSRVKNGNKGNS